MELGGASRRTVHKRTRDVVGGKPQRFANVARDVQRENRLRLGALFDSDVGFDDLQFTTRPGGEATGRRYNFRSGDPREATDPGDDVLAVFFTREQFGRPAVLKHDRMTRRLIPHFNGVFDHLFDSLLRASAPVTAGIGKGHVELDWHVLEGPAGISRRKTIRRRQRWHQQHRNQKGPACDSQETLHEAALLFSRSHETQNHERTQ